MERAREFERLLTSLDSRDLLEIEPQLRALTVPTLFLPEERPTDLMPHPAGHWAAAGTASPAA